MNKENQIEEMAQIIRNRLPHIGRACVEGECIQGDKNSVHENPCWCVYKEIAEMIYDTNYRKQSEGEWLPCIEDVEIYNSGGFTEKRQTGWICGNCKKGFSPCRKNFCSNCGAKMKGKEN